MNDQRKQELRDLRVKCAQHFAMLCQTFDNLPPKVDRVAWAKDVQKRTAVLDELAMKTQDVFQGSELGSNGRKSDVF